MKISKKSSNILWRHCFKAYLPNDAFVKSRYCLQKNCWRAPKKSIDIGDWCHPPSHKYLQMISKSRNKERSISAQSTEQRCCVFFNEVHSNRNLHIFVPSTTSYHPSMKLLSSTKNCPVETLSSSGVLFTHINASLQLA